MNLKKRIEIATQFIAWHQWPEAPAQVSFLRSLHRHLFGVRVQFEVCQDRELEFFIMQSIVSNLIRDQLLPGLRENSSWSCERIAEFLFVELAKAYPVLSVEVNEDNENGSIVSVC